MTQKAKNFLLKIGTVLLLTLLIPVFNPYSDKTSAADTLTGKTSAEITAEMGIGWNLGNTFDATGGNRSDIYSQETSWGNPKVTRELIQAIHDRGFKTIRIPVTWMNHIQKDGGYTINPAFFARVKEVVDYAYELNMYIIINAHHESWINTSKLGVENAGNSADGTPYSGYFAIADELSAVWSQIADYFADYDQHLIFEGMNEPRLKGTSIEWTGNSSAYDGVNYLNQVFTYTVRNNGKGHNNERCLMIPGYAASSSADIMKALSIPTYQGEPVNNLIISVHCYSPYDFCLSDNMEDFDSSNKQHTSSIDSVFKNIEELFLFNNLPVVIGETGATNTNNNTKARENWAEYMGKKAYEYGVPIIIWDNGAYGTSGGECHAWINRRTCEWNFPTVIDKLFEAESYIDWGEKSSIDKLAYDETSYKPSISGGTVIWENNAGTTVSKLGAGSDKIISVPVLKKYIIASFDIAVAYTGESSVRLDFYGESADTTATGVEPYKTEEAFGKKVAYFKFRNISETIRNSDLAMASNVTDMSITSTGEDLTVYEIASVLIDATTTYVVGSKEYTGTSSFNDGIPSLPGLKFLGWYSSPVYEKGTEFNGKATRNLTVYAKFALNEDTAADKYVVKPVNTGTDTDTDTDAVTDTETETDKPISVTDPVSTPDDSTQITPEPSAPEKTKDNSESSGPFPIIIIVLLIGAAAGVVGAVTIIIVSRRKKG